MKSILWLLILLTGTAQASDFYAVAGFGKSVLHPIGVDNVWSQQGFELVTEEKSNAWKVGVGLHLTRWLAAEMDYRDLGQFNSNGVFVADAGRPGDYVTAKHACDGPCTESIAGYQHGTTKGIGLSLIAAPDWTVAPFVRVGAFYHKSEFSTVQLPTDQQHATHFFNRMQFNDSGIGPMVGAGIRMDWLEVEWNYYPKAAGTDSPYSTITSVMVNVRKGF